MAAEDEPEAAGDTPPEDGATAERAALEQQQQALLAQVASATLNTVESKVAWLLNNYPETRNSDVTLQLAYWDTFESDYHGGAIARDDLYRFARLNTLTRARATIQNKLKLFQASPEVRSRRGTLAKEEKDSAVRPAPHPMYAVFADESGKSQETYVVGSLWALHGPETLKLTHAIRAWRDLKNTRDEFHFTNISAGNLQRYCEFVDLVLTHGAILSFKSASVGKAGAGSQQEAFKELFYQLTARGIEHEHKTQRAQLPRTLQFWKDAEEEGYDKLLLANLEDRLKARFQDDLAVDVMWAVSSKGNELLQMADLFTGAVNRVVNPPAPPPKAPAPKDEFATHLLKQVGWNPAEGDMAVTISL